VTNINPNSFTFRNVASGLSGSSGVRKITIHIRTVDAPGATCDQGENSGPVDINLKLVDPSGVVIVDDAKQIMCTGGPQKVTREIFFQTPDNCEGGAAHDPPNSTGVIRATGSAPGAPDYVENLTIRCNW
jgi:hypothetical protein